MQFVPARQRKGDTPLTLSNEAITNLSRVGKLMEMPN